MRGFFSLEMLFIFFLMPYLFFILETEPVPILRETEVYAQDAAQMLVYGHHAQDIPTGDFAIWLDGVPTRECNYRFRYCTRRFYEGGEHEICAAECLR
jgi:hypothetical protein